MTDETEDEPTVPISVEALRMLVKYTTLIDNSALEEAEDALANWKTL